MSYFLIFTFQAMTDCLNLSSKLLNCPKFQLNPIAMKRKSIYILLAFCCFAIVSVSAQATKPVMKVTIPGYPTFVITSDSMMPTGATGGVVTFVKAADNLDAQFDKDKKNKTSFATLDIAVYNSNGGQLTKSKTFHFTKLVIQSLIANYQSVTALGFGFDNMTQN
jgi:signal peptidase I